MDKQYISMSKKELGRLDIINRSLRKEITVKKVAELLGISTRQTYRIRSKIRQRGSQGLVHGNRGKISNRRICEEEKKQIVDLLHKHYSDFGPTLATEKLERKHSIKKSRVAIRSIMIEQGLWKPKKRKNAEYRSKRARKDHFGEMEQFDGSYHAWFEDRAPKCCLLAGIDDAAGIVTHAKFVESEGTLPVFSFWYEYLLLRGKPASIYLDRLRTYSNNGVSEEERKHMLTQFQRAMKEIGIKTISSHSPQARGRVERLFHTLQDRMVKEMRLAGVSSKKQGNAFLKEYLPVFNKRFGVEPKNGSNLHRKVTAEEKKVLLAILSRQKRRIVKNDFTIRLNNLYYQLTKEQPATIRPKDKVIVEERFNGSIYIRLRNKYLNYEVLPESPPPLGGYPWIIPASQKSQEEYHALAESLN